jgi:hypothetical protein
MKTYLSKYEVDPYEGFQVLYVGEDKEIALSKIEKFEEDERYDFSIEVWEYGKVIGRYIWDDHFEFISKEEE